MAARFLLGARGKVLSRPYCSAVPNIAAAKLVTPQQKILITAKLSHRSKDSGGTGVCLEHAVLLAAKLFLTAK
tara:strand:- start:935 stop:1153 length:219 start_codon:yes stop_codon:yes gene_type:complete